MMINDILLIVAGQQYELGMHITEVIGVTRWGIYHGMIIYMDSESVCGSE